MSRIKEIIVAFGEIETDSITGMVNLGGIAVIGSLFLFSGITISPPSSGVILKTQLPHHNYIIAIALLIIISASIAGHFSTRKKSIETENINTQGTNNRPSASDSEQSENNHPITEREGDLIKENNE